MSHEVSHNSSENSLAERPYKALICGTLVLRPDQIGTHNEKEQNMSDTAATGIEYDSPEQVPPEGATGEGTMKRPWFPEVEVQLSGNDGNAFMVMGLVSKALRRSGVPSGEISRYSAESMAGDYDALLQTAMRWVEVV